MFSFQGVREEGREVAAERQGAQPSMEPEGSAATIAHPTPAKRSELLRMVTICSASTSNWTEFFLKKLRIKN
jgi:hypothetical protein